MIYNTMDELEAALKTTVRAGRKLCVSIYHKGYGPPDQRFQPYIVSKRKHVYSARSSYGKRTGWREESNFGIPQTFGSRLEALRCARGVIQKVSPTVDASETDGYQGPGVGSNV